MPHGASYCWPRWTDRGVLVFLPGRAAEVALTNLGQPSATISDSVPVRINAAGLFRFNSSARSVELKPRTEY